jgi:outer membrane protein assembly factor BamB
LGAGQAGRCESDDKPVLSRERQPALWPEPEVAADPAVADWTIQLPHATRDDWRQARANSENRPGHRVLARRLDLAWTERLGRGLSASRFAMPAPVVQGDRVYAMDAVATVKALDATDGSVRWTRDLSAGDASGLFGGGFAVSGGRLRVTNGAGEVFALDMRGGARVWTASVGGLTAPAVGAETLFALDRSGRVAALTAGRGRVVCWAAVSGIETGGDQVWTSPLLVDDSILLVGADGTAVFMDPATGEVEETERLGDRPTTPPVVSSGRRYLVSGSGRKTVYE